MSRPALTWRLAARLVALTWTFAWAPSVFAGLGVTPYGMNFSGYLEQTSIPVDTNVYMEFQILANGSSLWCGEYSAVAVSNGYFSVDLGSSSEGGAICGSTVSLPIDPSLLASVSSGTDMELSVQVSPDGSSWESFSNIPIASSIFALQADIAQTALNATAIAGFPVAPSPSPSPSQVLEYNGSAWVPADVASGGAATGVLGAVQFNDGSGGFGSNSSSFVWDSMNNRLGIGTAVPASALNVTTLPSPSANVGSVCIGEGGWGGAAGNFNGNGSGTELAINAVSTFSGNLIDLQTGGVSEFSVSHNGTITTTGGLTNSGGTTSSGPVSINTTGTGVTVIGGGGGMVSIGTSGSETVSVGSASNTTSVTGSAVTINSSGSGTTSVGTGTGATTIGNATGTTTIQGPTALSSVTSFSGTTPGSILFTTTSTNDVATDNAKLSWTDSTGSLTVVSSATGVYGNSTAGTGVEGTTSTGTGGYFSSTSGYGLIVASGKVGIGSTAPIALLDVEGGNLNLQNTNSSGLGAITFGGARMIHNYGLADANNFFAGSDAGNFSMTSGANDETGIGDYALEFVTSGPANTAIGYSSLNANTTGSNNTALGATSLGSNTTGHANTGLGSNALGSNTAAYNNTAVGYNALSQNGNDGDTTAVQNTAVGVQALESNVNGGNNAATGFDALMSNTSGSANTATGEGALSGNTTGSSNVAIGWNAEEAEASYNETTVIGATANAQGNNGIAIGYGAVAPANTAVIGSSSITTTVLNGNVGIGTTAPGATLDVNGHIGNSGGATVTVTTDSGGTCTLQYGNDTRGQVQIGANGKCTINFTTNYGSPPTCVIAPVDNDPGAGYIVSSGTNDSGLEIYNTNGLTTTTFNYICMQ